MTQKKYGHALLYPLGVTQTGEETTVLLCARGEEAKLLLTYPGEEKKKKEFLFRKEERVGDVWHMTVDSREFAGAEYGFEVDGKPVADPYARVLAGREKWNDSGRVGKPLRARLAAEPFDWEDDRSPELPWSEMILYRLHVRGFTKHPSSKAAARGTFAGIEEKIPYLKELGVTSLVLLPVTEFDEILQAPAQMESAVPAGSAASMGTEMPLKCGTAMPCRVNYWGYGPSFLYAVKAAYGSGRTSPEAEFKSLVRALHREKLECIPELYFTGEEAPGQVLNVLRYCVEEYHVDGFWLSGFAPKEMIARDPFLARTKLFAESWDGIPERQGGGYPQPGEGTVTVREKHLAECGTQFQDEMRRFLKGDEGMLQALEYRTRRNPAGAAVVNYMASTNGFTMMDLVSYDRKHNEKNGEDNRDGNDHNYSWNCGAEGPTRKKKILELRRRQLANAFLLLFLSQGVPMILAGDEFGNSQNGNNNAYCQDNEISWLNWKLLETNGALFRFVKGLIAFRKAHPVFHMEREPRILDYKSCGRPDISYHGENVWKPEYENFRRQFGILYWGAYGVRADGSEDNTFYVTYNMHWEPHVFGLPRLKEGQLWYEVYNSADGFAAGDEPEKLAQPLKNQLQIAMPPRSILVFESRRINGACGGNTSIEETARVTYFVYNMPVGKITVICKGGAVAGIHFGSERPAGETPQEVRTELSDRTAAQLEEYFNGARTSFDVPLAPEGTEFQKKVWHELTRIPYGETRSYKEVAAAIGDAKATRAVGMANNRNPIAIMIPCHRVIGANGLLTGYAGGLEVKRQLLELERRAAGDRHLLRIN